MAILSIDETTGQQTTTSELSSFTAGNLPVIFQNVLTTLDTADTTDIGTISGISVSNYAEPGATTGATFINFTGDVSDIGFVDSTGAAFDGDPSGLKTTDGSAITLWTYSGNNNILLGRLADGTVVFAAYLETFKSDNSIANAASGTDIGATKAKLWLVQYETLQHIVSGNPVDVVSLAGILNLGINTITEFDATGAPAGNNLFLMMGDGDPVAGEAGLVVTGKTPANESVGVAVSSGSTVNTGKGGGETTIGTDNQMVVPNKGVYFTFVELSADSIPVTIPELDHGEATDESNIKFSAYEAATGATFTVVQTQPPKATTIKLTAINNDETAAATDEDAFIDDILTTLASDPLINIYTVTVVRTTAKGKDPVNGTFVFTEGGTTSHTGADLTLDFTGSSVVIKGIIAGDVITYSTGTNASTPLNHNRLLVENTGTVANYDAGFDIGDFSISGGSLSKVGLDALDFFDDVPAVDPNTATASLVTDDTDIPDTAGPTSFAGLFTTINFGNDGFKDSNDDGIQDSDAVVYTLAVGGAEPVNSGLSETLSGDKIYLYLESGVVTGRVGLDDDAGANAAGAIAFTISVNAATGAVTQTQNLAVVHNDPADAVESGTSAASMAAGAVTLTVTVKDNDLDTDTAVRNVGDMFKFEDDGPSIAVSATALPSMVTDDTEIVDTAGPTSFASAFGTPNFGKDGFKDANDDNLQDSDAVVYSLAASLTGADSGLVDTASGKKIFLFLQSGVVNGRVADLSTNTANSFGAIAFAITVNTANAEVTLTQNRAILHNDPLDPVETGASAAVMVGTGLVGLTATVTDGDLDTAGATRDITSAFAFEDDGPAVAFGNVVGTGSTLAQTGYWSMTPGDDGLGATGLNISVPGNTFTLVRPNNTTTTGTATFAEANPGSPDGSGSYLFSGTLTGDFDNDANTANQTVNFSLTAYVDGHYTIQLPAGFASTASFSSADGALGAGGPDPVQTLTVGTEQIVFFAVNPTATTGGLASAIVAGAPDQNEATLQQKSSMVDHDGISGNGNQPGDGTYPFITDTYAMNVSTSGIGVNNNVLQGDASAAITAVDESFVINPVSLLSSVKIYIDNSVAGYNMATEDLWYRIFYTDGTTQTIGNLTEVNSVTAEAGGQVSFTLSKDGTKMIDAVQLTMGKGAIKIPTILFTTETEALASDVKIDFLASVTDGDGDTATDAFSANLYANELAGSTYDFILPGTSAPDAFNIDLSTARNKYQVTGFDTANDLLVLLPAAGGSASINNGGSDSIVTITEAVGGQITTVTVVGVDLTADDVVGATSVGVV